jgi:hypothetical protein
MEKHPFATIGGTMRVTAADRDKITELIREHSRQDIKAHQDAAAARSRLNERRVKEELTLEEEALPLMPAAIALAIQRTLMIEGVSSGDWQVVDVNAQKDGSMTAMVTGPTGRQFELSWSFAGVKR